jgi:hypothetical protein
MAKTQEELLQEIESLKAQNKDLRKEADRLQNAIETAKDGVVALPVRGSYEVTLTTPDGKSVKRKVEFKDGRHRVVIPNLDFLQGLAGNYAGSEALLKLANGKAVTQDDLNKYPVLGKFNQEKAAALLEHFASIQAGILK